MDEHFFIYAFNTLRLRKKSHLPKVTQPGSYRIKMKALSLVLHLNLLYNPMA